MEFADISQEKRDKVRRTVSGLLRVLVLTAVLWFVFHKHYREIYENICDIKIPKLIFIILQGTSYEIIGAAAFYFLVRKNNPQFTMRQSLETTYLGFFGNVTFSVGSLPIRAYYMHTNAIDAGKAVGLINADYILNKSSVLICNTVLLLFGGFRFLEKRKNLLPYILFGYLICSFVIGILLLVGFSEKVYNKLNHLLTKAPKKKKWAKIKEKALYHLEMMHDSSEEIKENRKNILFITALHCLKLLIMYEIPYICLKSIMNSSVSFFEILMMSALANLISGALPSVSGVGGMELAFFLVFGSFTDHASTASVLVLYRLATYFVPFLISVVVFNRIEKRRIRKKEDSCGSKKRDHRIRI